MLPTMPSLGLGEGNGFELDTEDSQLLEFDNQFSLNGPLYTCEPLLNTTSLLESSHVNVATTVYNNFSGPTSVNATDSNYIGLHNMIDPGIGAEPETTLQLHNDILHNTDDLEWDLQAKVFQATMWIFDRNMRPGSSTDISFTAPRVRSNTNEDENSNFTRNYPRDILLSGPSRADSILKGSGTNSVRRLVENAPGWEIETDNNDNVTFSLKKDNPGMEDLILLAKAAPALLTKFCNISISQILNAVEPLSRNPSYRGMMKHAELQREVGFIFPFTDEEVRRYSLKSFSNPPNEVRPLRFEDVSEAMDYIIRLYLECSLYQRTDREEFRERCRKGEVDELLLLSICATSGQHASKFHMDDRVSNFFLQHIADHAYSLTQRPEVRFRLVTEPDEDNLEILINLLNYTLSEANPAGAYLYFQWAVDMAFSMRLYERALGHDDDGHNDGTPDGNGGDKNKDKNKNKNKKNKIVKRERYRRLWACLVWFDIAYAIFSGHPRLLPLDHFTFIPLTTIPQDDEFTKYRNRWTNASIRGLSILAPSPDIDPPQLYKNWHEWWESVLITFEIDRFWQGWYNSNAEQFNRSWTHNRNQVPPYGPKYRYFLSLQANFWGVIISFFKNQLPSDFAKIVPNSHNLGGGGPNDSPSATAFELCTHAANEISKTINFFYVHSDFCHFAQVWQPMALAACIHMYRIYILKSNESQSAVRNLGTLISAVEDGFAHVPQAILQAEGWRKFLHKTGFDVCCI